MNLVQKNRLCPNLLTIAFPVGADRAGVISHMIAQVQARIGTRGNTTVAHTAIGLDAFRP